MKELTDLIEKIVTEKTFSLEAAKVVEDLKQRFGKIETECEYYKEKTSEYVKVNSELENNLSIRDARIAALEDQVRALKSEQEQARASIYAAEKEKAVADAYKDAFHTVFKPNTVRESVHRTMPIVRNYGNNCGDTVEWTQTTENVIKEEG